MNYKYPHTIDNGAGEEITFLKKVSDPAGDYVEITNFVLPGSGPPMHVHFKQVESLTVVEGKMGVKVRGRKDELYGPGDTVTFRSGEYHKFWNAGTVPLICHGWVKPAHNIEYFLTKIYESVKANGGNQPGKFDAAFLLHRYRSEFDMTEIPVIVRKLIFPIILFFGKLRGKYRKFDDAPLPVK